MFVKKTKSKNSEHYSIIYNVTVNGKRTSKVYENIGNYNDLKIKANGEDHDTWLKNYVNELNNQIKENSLPALLKKLPNKKLPINKQFTFNGGYLFLQNIYYDLKLNNICDNINEKHQFKYDLNDILSKLVYSRIIYPSSKLKTLELSNNFIEQPNFKYQHILRGLEIIAKESDFIQSELYKNSLKYSERNDKILFYDYTNYFFEIEEDDDFKKYSKSKEHRPNPIVGMGLFMDDDGIPISFDIFPGNQNEQVTLRPLEEKINDEAKYDGLYGVCTNLEDVVKEIIKINKRRWEIEESFRIMKTEFKSRLVYLSKKDRIKAHFTTCFLALVIFRYLEKKLNEQYTSSQIVETLKTFNFKNENDIGYSPLYTRTELTDLLHKVSGFETDFEFIENKNIKKIINKTKK